MRRCFAKGGRAFTLIELLATVVIIAILAAITLGVVSYVQQRIAISTTKAQIATMSAALEMYKSDWGYYPWTAPERISSKGLKEATNNMYLYRALSGTCANCTKRYMTFPPQQTRTNTLIPQTGYLGAGGINFFDPWGTPYNYYCSPATTYGVSNALPANWPPYIAPYTSYGSNWWYGGTAFGGQVNVSSYDLWSYGPDKSTFVPGAIAYQGGFNYAWYYGVAGNRWTNPAAAFDDIANFKR